MSKLVSNFFISLDGVVESPDKWHFPYFNDEMGAAVMNPEVVGVLMGRVLYGEWSVDWPGRDDPFADWINAAPKYVVSDTLESVDEWANSTLIGNPSVEDIQRVKDESEGDLMTSGSGTLVRWLLANGLVDELRLMLHPIVVGSGARLFPDGPQLPLELVSETRFKTGVLDLTYVPAS